MNDRNKCEKWLENYLTPQMSRSAEKIKELFVEDCIYHYGPYYEPRKGLEAAYQHHKNALSHQHNLKYTWKLLAVTPEFALAWFDLTLTDDLPDVPNSYQGIFKFTLDDNGKCSLFEEWYNMA